MSVLGVFAGISVMFSLCILAIKACDWLWFHVILPKAIERLELVRVMQYVRQERGAKMTRKEIKAYKRVRREQQD